MTTLEDLYNLPMSIMYDSVEYTLRIFVTAWDKFCISYVPINNTMGEKVFSVVIEPEAKSVFTSDDPYSPDTVRSFDEAYTLLYDTLVSWGYIDIEKDFDYTEESGIKPYVEAPVLEFPNLQ